MRILKTVFLILGITGVIFSQDPVVTVTAQPDLAEWDIIYLTDFDFENGMNNPLIFGYRLEVQNLETDDQGNYPEDLQPVLEVSLSMTADVPSLNLDNELLFQSTATLTLKAPILITNRDLDVNIESRGLMDENGNKINVSNFQNETIDPDEAESLISTVLSSGSMPAGYYYFALAINSADYGVEYIGFDPEKHINITTPANIDLTFPPDMHEFVGDIYPVFEWNSSGCEDYYIRICEFDPMMHGSYEDAIQSEASFPYPDNGGYVSVGSLTQLDYSSADGRPLEVGKSYVWRIKKVCATTGAEEEIFSEVYGFTITQVGQTFTPCQQQLRTILGDNQFNALFGPDGPLEGYGECTEFLLDNEQLSTTEFATLLIQLVSGAYEIESITTQ